MTVSIPRFYMPLVQWMDAAGVPLAGGKLYFYESETDTPLATYSDPDLQAPHLNANPVVADANGVWGSIYLQHFDYKVVLKTTNDTLVWTADPVSDGNNEPVIESFYDFPVYVQGKPTNSEVYPVFNTVRSVTLPADLTDSLFSIGTLPTGTLTITLYKDASSIGTIAFSTAGIATVTFASDVTFSAGNKFSMLFPASADATGADISFTFVFTIN